ncbi:hypothetical protein AYJ58_17785 [Shewanella sp. Pdp11]|uniref:hypothetical protein n=1 Tax=Shewanella sp. Pdp11 TaxID=2059264 RepID=UPI000CA26F3C|nr:hypothetical protein [Shewanella sp. Pdp11]AUD61213.1 hypothetical protein AYJ58_17785 [Shewanella sp. Pdp11]
MAQTKGPFDWIDFKNVDMVRWAEDYFLEKKIILPYPVASASGANKSLDKVSFEIGLGEYKEHYGNELLLVRNMKDAWRSVIQRKENKKNGKVSITYPISTKHHSQLRELAVKVKLPLNQALENLIDKNFQNLIEQKEIAKSIEKEKRDAAKAAKQALKTPPIDSYLMLQKSIAEKNQQIDTLSNNFNDLHVYCSELLDLIERTSTLFSKDEQKNYRQLTEKLNKLNANKVDDTKVKDQQ